MILVRLLEMDMFLDFIQKTLYRLLKVHVPTQLVMQVVGSVVPLSLETTPSNASHFLSSLLCAKLVGLALGCSGQTE